MADKPSHGFFISVEGGEGAGKTTLIEGLVKELSNHGYTVVSTREPGGTEIGEEIRKLLLHKDPAHPMSMRAELMLFLAARAQHYEQIIMPALYKGSVVICDRFHDSTIAYQGIARGLGEEAVSLFSLYVTDGLEPDLTFYLDIDPEIGFKRGRREHGKEAGRSSDRIESETLEFHKKVRAAFTHLVLAAPNRCRMIDATLSADTVLKQAMQHFHDLEKSFSNEAT